MKESIWDLLMAPLMIPTKAFQRVHCLVLHLDLLMVSALGPTNGVSDIGNDGMI